MPELPASVPPLTSMPRVVTAQGAARPVQPERVPASRPVLGVSARLGRRTLSAALRAGCRGVAW